MFFVAGLREFDNYYKKSIIYFYLLSHCKVVIMRFFFYLLLLFSAISVVQGAFWPLHTFNKEELKRYSSAIFTKGQNVQEQQWHLLYQNQHKGMFDGLFYVNGTQSSDSISDYDHENHPEADKDTTAWCLRAVSLFKKMRPFDEKEKKHFRNKDSLMRGEEIIFSIGTNEKIVKIFTPQEWQGKRSGQAMYYTLKLSTKKKNVLLATPFSCKKKKIVYQ